MRRKGRNKMKYLFNLSRWSYNPYYVPPHIKKPSKTYENKNRNIEYYTDEKGNIKRRKKGIKK